MTKDVTSQGWLKGWRSSEPQHQPDPADLGTAFGLELSMSNAEAEFLAAKRSSGRKPGWVYRLAARRKPLT